MLGWASHPQACASVADAALRLPPLGCLSVYFAGQILFLLHVRLPVHVPRCCLCCSEKTLGDFASSVLDGTAEAEYKSAPIPDEPTDGGVTIIVGKNFESIVKDEEKDVLLEVSLQDDTWMLPMLWLVGISMLTALCERKLGAGWLLEVRDKGVVIAALAGCTNW